MITIGDEFPDDAIELFWRADKERGLDFKACGHFCGKISRATLATCCQCGRSIYDPCGLCGHSMKSSGLPDWSINQMMEIIQAPITTTVNGGSEVIIPFVADRSAPPGQFYLMNTKYIRQEP